MGWGLLVLGVCLWGAAHVFKRVAPERRNAMGEAGRGVVTVALFVALALIVFGYRSADGAVFWGRSSAIVGINNLLMLVAVYLFAAAGMKTAVTARLRHPQLTAVKIWATAHLLVNGDLPSFVLFGGMLAWAVYEVVLINKQTEWEKPKGPFPARKEVVAVVATLVVYGVIASVHMWLGYPVFG